MKHSRSIISEYILNISLDELGKWMLERIIPLSDWGKNSFYRTVFYFIFLNVFQVQN